MTVPLDYADPSGPTVAIAVARLPALNGSARGSIVVKLNRLEPGSGCKAAIGIA